MRKMKVAKTDFTKESLPQNRFEVFSDVFKIRFRTLIQVGLLLLVFLIPFFIVRLLEFSSLITLGSQFSTGAISNAEYEATYISVKIMTSIFLVIAIMIASVGFAGGIKVIRRLVWGEPVFFKDDFLDGIKQNAKRYLLFAFIIGLINLLNQYINYSPIDKQLIKGIPFGVFYVIFLPTFLIIFARTPIYNEKLSQSVKHSFLLYMKTLPKTLLATLCLYSVFLINLIRNLTAWMFVFIIFMIVVAPLYLLGYFLYCNWMFDKYINATYYPEIVDKGIYRDKKPEYEVYKLAEEIEPEVENEEINEIENDESNDESPNELEVESNDSNSEEKEDE